MGASVARERIQMKAPPMKKWPFALLLLLFMSAVSLAQQETSGKDEALREFRWKRHARNPVFPALPSTWMESQTANPDLLLNGDTYVMYFRGQ